jgi:23S rRNA (guanosine2251-2'-O)-methyltransferase
MEVLYGLHPVSEALKAGRRRFDHVLVARERHDDRLDRVIAQCRDAGIRVREESREQLTLAANTPAHQGVVALVRPQEFLTIEDLFESEPATNKSPSGKTARLVLAIDGVEDPQNLGALLRVADGAGVDGVLLTERRSAPLSPAAVKASAGAAEHLRIARVVNLVRSLEELKKHNLWIVGLDAGGLDTGIDAGAVARGPAAGPTPRGAAAGPSPYDQFDFTGDLVIVLGSEGAGLHELVRRTCDHLLHIPMAGGVSSLNVSAAGAVVLFEAARQRRAAAKSHSGTAKALTTQPASSKPKKQKGLGS